MARYGLFVLKVPLNPNQPTNHVAYIIAFVHALENAVVFGVIIALFNASYKAVHIYRNSARLFVDPTMWCEPYVNYPGRVPGIYFITTVFDLEIAGFTFSSSQRWYDSGTFALCDSDGVRAL